MSKGVNKFIGIGTVGQEPDCRTMPNGNSVVNLSIAVNESWKDGNGEKQERTEWIKIVFFNRLAEVVEQYVKKGSKIYVEGRLQTRQWEKEGQKHYTTEIVASEMQMLDSRVSGSQTGNTAATQQRQSQPQAQPDFSDMDSVPF